MNPKRLGSFTAISCLLLAGSASAQLPDIAISQIATGGDIAEYGQSGDKAAYSFATTSCNVGNIVVDWFDHLGRAPLIAQNMFRIADGRIEQLGYSFLKLSFCAVSEPSCGSCISTGCNTLGIGCADTYGSGLNDGAFGGAGKWIWNPTIPQIWPGNVPTSTGTLPLRGRLVTPAAKMAQPGSVYLIESQYLSRHDQEYGLGRNNCSWRYVNSNTIGSMTNAGPMQIGDPGIFAWQDTDPTVTIVDATYIGEGNSYENGSANGSNVNGHIFLGYKTTDLGGGLWRYEYAVQNVDSHAAIGSFELPLDCGANITEPFFQGVEHHSGDPRSNAPWVFANDGTTLSWTVPEDFATNENASAIWWGELFNFGFTADLPPAQVQLQMATFRPNPRPAHAVTVMGPCESAICGIETYCVGAPNSQGGGATINAIGDANISANNIKLQVSGGIPNAFGLFFYGPNQVQVAFGDGFRCVGGMTNRLQPVVQMNGLGGAAKALDLTAPPANGGSGLIESGDTVNFQYWYRDNPAGLSGFNLTDAVSVTFCP